MARRQQGSTQLEGAGRFIEPSKLDFRVSEIGRATITAGPRAIRHGAVDNVLYIQPFLLKEGQPAVWFMVVGMKPNAPHELEVYYPEDSYMRGARYTYLKSEGTDRFGAASKMLFDPFHTRNGWPDPEGVYRMVYTDPSNGRRVEVFFVIKYDRSLLGQVMWWRHAIWNVGRRQISERTPQALKERVKRERTKLGALVGSVRNKLGR